MLESPLFESLPAVDLGQDSPYRSLGRDEQRLVWTGGVSSLTLDSSRGSDVVETDFGDADMRVLRSEHEIRISQGGTFWTRALDALIYGFDPEPRARVGLSRDYTWQIDCRGGASELDARLGDVRLTGFSIRGGVSDSYLRLGAPRGHAKIRVSGGVSRLEICRPRNVGLRLWIRGGVSHLTFDAMELDGVGGKLALASEDCASQSDVYDLEIRGGASDLVLTTR
jgi:hypothetical protein